MMDVQDCKHEKLTTKSSTKIDSVTKIVQYCSGCNSVRDREILSVRLGVDKDGRSGFTCFSDDIGKWTPLV